MAVIKISAAKLTFAFFMVINLYCKLNEFRARIISLERVFYPLDRKSDNLVAWKQKEFADIFPFITEHRSCFPKAEKKLPTWVKHRCLFASTPYEQCSSELVATYRASLFPASEILSLTGGLGVDDWAFATAGHRVTSLDPDACLNELFQFNATQLQLQHCKRLTSTAEEYLADNPNTTYDIVYLDPDRRSSGNRATHQTHSYSPDFLSLMRQYPDAAKTWLVKLSPMVDVTWLRTQFAQPVDIHVIESGAELKELMLVHSAEAKGNTILVSLNQQTTIWNGRDNLCQNEEALWFTEASAACIKCGFHLQLEASGQLKAVNSNHTFFTGKASVPRAVGRSFRLLQQMDGSLGDVARWLKKEGIDKASVTCRDFVLDADGVRKKLGLADGGRHYLFFTGRQQKMCFVCVRESES